MEAKRMKLYIVPHSHIDMEWYWTVADVENMLPELFYNSALRMLEQDEEMTFAQDQSCLLSMVLEHASDRQKKLISEWVASGRMEPVGGMYVQPELQEPCGEALIRQIRAGQKWLGERLGTKAQCAWYIDSFGQIDQLPQILTQNGFTGYVFMRDLPEGEDPQQFPAEFFCEGPDGSRILTHWLKNTYVLCGSGREDYLLKIANVDVTPENEAEELRKVFAAVMDENSLQHQTGAALILWGDDLYAQKQTTAQIKQLLLEAAERAGADVREEDIVFSTPSQFFDAIRKRKEVIPVRSGDFGLPLYRQDLRATFVSRIKLKLLNRKAEQALLSLESLAALLDKELPELEQLWEKVLFNQFHDTIAGSCVDEVYLAAVERYQEVLTTVSEKKRELLGGKVGGSAFCVFNSTQFVRSEVIRLPVGKADGQLCVQDRNGTILPSCHIGDMLEVAIEQIEPYSVEYYRFLPETTSATTEQAAETVENEYYRLTIDLETGDLTGIWDKQACKALLREPANVLVAKQEENPEMEGALCLTGTEQSDQGIKADSMKTFCTVDGAGVVCVKQFLGFEVEKRIALRNGSRKIEFATNIRNYTGEDYLLLTRFPMQMEKPSSLFETPFSVVTGREGFACAQKWAALVDGAQHAALLNRGTCGYWVEGGDLSMALLRGHRHYVQYGINGRERGIERFFDGKTHAELAAEKGNHSFEYAMLCGTYTTAQLAAEALMYNSPVEAVSVDEVCPVKQKIRTVTSDFIITNMARCGDELQIRGYSLAQECKTCQITFAEQLVAARCVDLKDDEVCTLCAEGNAVRFETRPYEIVTLRVRT